MVPHGPRNPAIASRRLLAPSPQIGVVGESALDGYRYPRSLKSVGSTTHLQIGLDLEAVFPLPPAFRTSVHRVFCCDF